MLTLPDLAYLMLLDTGVPRALKSDASCLDKVSICDEGECVVLNGEASTKMTHFSIGSGESATKSNFDG